MSPKATPDHPPSSRSHIAMLTIIAAAVMITFTCLKLDNYNLSAQQKATDAKLDLINDRLLQISEGLEAVGNRQELVLQAMEHEALQMEAVLSVEKAAGEIQSIDSAINSFMAEVEMAFGTEGEQDVAAEEETEDASADVGDKEMAEEQPEL